MGRPEYYPLCEESEAPPLDMPVSAKLNVMSALATDVCCSRACMSPYSACVCRARVDVCEHIHRRRLTSRVGRSGGHSRRGGGAGAGSGDPTRRSTSSPRSQLPPFCSGGYAASLYLPRFQWGSHDQYPRAPPAGMT